MSATGKVGAERRYAAYAGGWLSATVLAGVWMRGAMLEPSLAGGLEMRNMIHAHSHLAFFGWATMALMAVIVRLVPRRSHASWLGTHAHAVGAASGLAFVVFLLFGYAPVSIAVATLHVVLWLPFVRWAWRAVGRAIGEDEVVRRWLRAALGFLVLAALASVSPAIAVATGATDWARQVGVEAFLTPFAMGWLFLGSTALLMDGATGRTPAIARGALALLVTGTLPSLLARTVQQPPFDVLASAGRLGLVLTGAGSLLAAVAAWRASRVWGSPLARLAIACIALKGVAELAVVIVPGLQGAAANRSLVVAYLHLVLLGGVTSALAALLFAGRAGAWTARLHALGLAATLASLGVLGLPTLSAYALRAGVGAAELMWLALVGGLLSALALWLAVLPAGPLEPRTARAAGSRPMVATS